MAKAEEIIDENKIRQAIWMLDYKKATKKAACEFIGIKYNTKRLEKLISDYKTKNVREKELREKNKNKVFTKAEINSIIKDYTSGMAVSKIAKANFITDYRVKKILTQNNVPLRGRGKKKSAKTEHVVQDLDVKFNKEQRVFFGKESSFAIVDKVYDEDYVDYLLNPLSEEYVEHQHAIFDRKGKRICAEQDMKEDTHYTVYYIYEKGEKIKRPSVSDIVKFVEEGLATSGREFYRVWVLGDHKCFRYVNREDLFPVKEI